MSNLYVEFKRLIPDEPLQVGTVTQTYAGGASVTLEGGGVLRVRGEAALGTRVFVRAGVIEGPAPALTLVEIEI
jgi:hypothetical protein